MILLCLLGHKYELLGKGDMLRHVDNARVGTYVLSRCIRCGKIKRNVFK